MFGGNAVATWLATIEEEGGPNTLEVDLLLLRSDQLVSDVQIGANRLNVVVVV